MMMAVLSWEQEQLMTDGSFTVSITNPQYKTTVMFQPRNRKNQQVIKYAVDYTGTEQAPTSAPIASKITYNSYTSVTGTAGAVPNGAL